MPYEIPPWIRGTSPAEVGSLYMQGMHLGSQIAQQSNALAQQAQEVQFRAQIAQQQAQRNADLEQQRIAVQAQVHQQANDLQQQKLKMYQEKIGMETKRAAQIFQAQQGYIKRFQELGGTPEASRQALMEFAPQMGSQSAIAAMIRAGEKRDPVWVPPNAETGAPGYLQTSSGNVHIPAREKSDESGILKPHEILSALRDREKTLAKNPFIGKPIPPDADPKRAEEIRSVQQEYKDVRNKIDSMIKSSEDARSKGSSEVVRMTKDGRRGVFDANTKKFLRWANANE